MTIRLGIDLGGTKIELIALDHKGTVRHKHRVPTPAGDYHGTIAAIRGLVAEAESRLLLPSEEKLRVGIGIPGTLSKSTGVIKNANSTCLIGHPLDRDLQAALGRPVRLANDADCFALSEATDGAGATYANIFGVILGTGVGGGLVINKRVVSGPNGITGEWGHNSLPWPDPTLDETPGRDCYCGRAGCIETFLSGPGFALDADHGRGIFTDWSAEQIAQAAETGNIQALKALDRYIHRLAKSLALVINIIDPDAIVLGGGLSKIQPLYERVPESWIEFVFSDTVATRLLPPQHGDASGVRGAAWLWPLNEG